MGAYNIDFKPSVEKDVRRIPEAIGKRAMERIEALRTDPFPPDVAKLKGAERLYRIRVGDYRIIYEIDVTLRQILIHYIRHRSEVYRRL